MPNKPVTRRNFMRGCSSAIAAMAGSRLTMTAFADPNEEPNQEILVIVFLRGGCDGLNFVPPIAGDDRGYYESERSNLAIPTTGTEAALPLSGMNGSLHLQVALGLHPAAAPLFDLYQNGNLAIVHAAGLDYNNRSHFDMMDYIERGTPGNKTTATGWLTRHLQSAPNLPAQIIAPSMAMGSSSPASLLGSRETITLSSFSSFNLDTGPWRWQDAQRTALRKLYTGSTWLDEAGLQTLNAVDIIESKDTSNYTPANGVVYPNGTLGDTLQRIAQTIKFQIGLRIATVDMGGWDTHEYQGDNGSGYFSSGLVGPLSEALAAFYADLDGDNYTNRVTVVVMSEFGRKLIRNASGGTDHGHGNVMFVLGGQVNGGLYGTWPGLVSQNLYEGRDLAITTDYRRVLSEILIRRLENPNLGIVFPGYGNYSPLGIMQGTDLTPVYEVPSYEVYLPSVIR